MPKTLWLLPDADTGELAVVVDDQGRPILCEECPCHDYATCEEAVDARVYQMLAEIDPGTHQPIWQAYNTHTSDFQCATWLHDVELDTWTLSHQATGSLLIALRVGLNVADTAESTATLLTYAKVLQNLQTGKKRVVGCECRVRNYECSPRVVVLDDFGVAGSLPVWTPGEGDTYTQYDSCRVDTCALLKFKLQTAQYWHGGTMMGEGYYDWLLTPQQWEPANYRYQPFLQAIKWQFSTTTYAVTYINCDCTSMSTHNLAAGETCLEYAGICTLEDPCIALMLLHNRAEQNGWTWHGEGVMVHLAKVTVNNVTTYGDWYALREQNWSGGSYSEYIAYSKRMCCAETPDGYWVMGCDCGGVGYYAKNDPVAAYWLYLDLPGVCACPWEDGRYPDRELILAYPDLFGVDDIVWGNDNKFDYAYATTWYDMDTGQNVTSSYSGRGVCGYTYEPNQGHGGCTMYIDYRAMCFTGKAFDQSGNVKAWIRVIYPYGSQGAPYRYNTRQYFTSPSGNYIGSGVDYDIYDTVTFTGTQWAPFTDGQDIGYTITYSDGRPSFSKYGLHFTGLPYTWFHSGMSYGGAQVNGCQPTEEQETTYTDPSQREYVEEEAGCDDAAPTPCIGINTTAAHYWRADAVLTPDFTVVERQPCDIRYVEHDITGPDGSVMMRWYECFYTRKWITIGASAGAPMMEDGRLWCPWLILNINYVCTNKGFLVKGENSFHETYVLPGASNYQQYTGCWETPKEEQAHWLDETITCPADEDMHFCIEGFDVPADDDDEGENE